MIYKANSQTPHCYGSIPYYVLFSKKYTVARCYMHMNTSDYIDVNLKQLSNLIYDKKISPYRASSGDYYIPSKEYKKYFKKS